MSQPSGSPRPAPAALLPWALAQLDRGAAGVSAGLEMVAGDASNRRYFRLRLEAESYIVVEAPPQTEKNTEFVAVQGLLSGAGVQVPGILGVDYQRGFMLLQDFGDRQLLEELDLGSAQGWYREAFAVLRSMAAVDLGGLDWPRYDHALLSEELQRFPHWFAGELLGVTLSPPEVVVFSGFADLLIDSALAQPTVLVHRDFHSRNLMPQASGRLGVIDFQDAVLGPVTYDLASLLRDCYVCWPAQRVEQWALQYRESLLAQGLPAAADSQQFLRWFDLMGLQRHIKVLGTFARLYLRDGKPAYLQDLPLVLRYVNEMLCKYAAQEPVIAEFQGWFNHQLGPSIAAQSWSREL